MNNGTYKVLSTLAKGAVITIKDGEYCYLGYFDGDEFVPRNQPEMWRDASDLSSDLVLEEVEI
jgi:hypothetical protein